MSFVMSMYGGRSHIGEYFTNRPCPLRLCLLTAIDFRPKEFLKTSAYPEDSDHEESTMGKMPPSDSEDE
jgi:hypothetical protein